MSKDLATIMADIQSGAETDPVLLMMSKRYQAGVVDAQNTSEKIKQLEAQLKMEQNKFQQCIGRCNEVGQLMVEHANGGQAAPGPSAPESPAPPPSAPETDGAGAKDGADKVVPLPGNKGGKNAQRSKT